MEIKMVIKMVSILATRTVIIMEIIMEIKMVIKMVSILAT